MAETFEQRAQRARDAAGIRSYTAPGTSKEPVKQQRVMAGELSDVELASELKRARRTDLAPVPGWLPALEEEQQQRRQRRKGRSAGNG